MKRNSELGREGRKESYQEGSETKGNHSTEAAPPADRHQRWQQPRLPRTQVPQGMLCRASSGERWAAAVEAAKRPQWQHVPRSHQNGAVNGKPLRWLLAMPTRLGIKKKVQQSLIHGAEDLTMRQDTRVYSLLPFSSNLLKVTTLPPSVSHFFLSLRLLEVFFVCLNTPLFRTRHTFL